MSVSITRCGCASPAPDSASSQATTVWPANGARLSRVADDDDRAQIAGSRRSAGASSLSRSAEVTRMRTLQSRRM